MDPICIYLNGITKSYHPAAPPALDNIDAKLPYGQLIGIVGPDGAGKTTLLRLIAGLLLPSQGSISVAGYDTAREAPSIHAIASYMPQRFGLYEDLTVLQNLNLYADLRQVVGKGRQKAFDNLLRFTNLAHFQDRLAGALSGGMKQKLGLACALIRKPNLLLLDEPSVGVDPISRRELWKMVYALLDEKITVLWSTAYLDEAEKCDKVLLLSEGKLLSFTSPKEFTQSVQGRVFAISHISGNRRLLLKKILSIPDVIDGVIQGSDIRMVCTTSTPPQIQGQKDLAITPIQARFEDAFIEKLGKHSDGSSKLAEPLSPFHSTSGSAVEALGLTKRFGSFTAADDITFSIPNGEIFGLLGPNGAGKSTTFKMLCGLLKPSQGTARVNGLDLQRTPSQARSQIGYMAQKFSLYGNLSVRQNLEFFGGIYSLKGKTLRGAIDRLIDIFALEPYLNTSADELPLGFKQRLALSCATMHQPQVLFLDEPTSGVDPLTRREFWTHINGFVEKGVTAMVTTHFMDEAEYCDRIALVYRSKIIEIGTPEELKAKARRSHSTNPSLEETFIQLIEEYDAKNPQQ